MAIEKPGLMDKFRPGGRQTETKGEVGSPGGSRPKPKDGNPQYQNFYKDMQDFVDDLRKKIGFNVTISFIFEDNKIIMGIYFANIPRYKEVPVFQVNIEEADLYEPAENLTTVILAELTNYLEPYTEKN